MEDLQMNCLESSNKRTQINNIPIILLTIYILVTSGAYLNGSKLLIMSMIVLGYLIILFIPDNYYPLVVLFLVPNRAIFRWMGFDYFFNFALLLMLVKHIVVRKNFIVSRSSKNLFFIIACNIGGFVFLNTYSVGNIVSLISWMIGYLFVYVYLEEYSLVRKKDVYLYFAVGMICGCICGYASFMYQYNFHFPSNMRFSGLLRDPNVYGLVCCILAISVFALDKLQLKYKMFVFLFFSVLGAISMSKGFVVTYLFVVLILVIKIIRYKNSLLNFIIICLLFALCFAILMTHNTFLSNIVSNYLFELSSRFNGGLGDITSGRLEIWQHYFMHFFDRIYGVLFGYGLNYIEVEGLAANLGILGKSYETHNTYMDIITAFGIIGSIVYCFMIKFFAKHIMYRDFQPDYRHGKETLPLIALVTGTIFLSLLNGDYFILIVVAVFVLASKSNGKREYL